MGHDFSQPQRQAPIGMVIIFLNTVRNLVRAFFPLIVAYLIKPKVLSMLVLFGGGTGLFALSALIAYLKYRNFTFYLDREEETFVITEGVFNKKLTTIQLSKIQQVNISQSLIQKIIGVYALDLDTAGSERKEGNIKAISHPLALELKERLMENDFEQASAKEESAEKSETEQPFVKISLGSLIKLGATSNYLKSLSLLLVYFFTASEYIDQFLGGHDVVIKNIGRKVDTRQLIQSALLIFVILAVVLLSVNLIRIIVRYFNYNITKQHGNLLLTFGLLNTQSTIIKPERVQMVSVSRNYFQRKLDILQIKIRQTTEQNSGTIEIPGCNSSERDEILKLLFQQIPQKGLMLKPNFRKLGFSLFLWVVIPVAGFWIVSSTFMPDLHEYLNLLPIYAVLMAVFQYFRFRNYRLYIKDDFIIRQSGAWDVSNEIIQWSKIQHITTSQLLWHRHIDIVTLTLHTAGGPIVFELGNFTVIKKYVNWWLYKLETTDSNWM